MPSFGDVRDSYWENGIDGWWFTNGSQISHWALPYVESPDNGLNEYIVHIDHPESIVRVNSPASNPGGNPTINALFNDGTLHLNDRLLTLATPAGATNHGTITNAQNLRGNVFNENDGTLTITGSTVQMALTNRGAVNVTGGGPAVNTPALVNDGIINLSTGLSFESNILLSGSGTVRLANDATLSGGLVTQSAGHTISGYGTISVRRQLKLGADDN